MNSECPQDLLLGALAIVQEDNEAGLARLDRLMVDYSSDARLQFLRGSVLASLQRYDEAHEAMQTAVKLAPEFAVARFQLGLLEMSSGDAAAAQASWAPLDKLPPDNALRLFTQGLRHLIRDEFLPAIDLLEQGIARNVETPPINGDMQLIIAEVRRKLAEQGSGEEPMSSTQLLLNQIGRKPTKH